MRLLEQVEQKLVGFEPVQDLHERFLAPQLGAPDPQLEPVRQPEALLLLGERLEELPPRLDQLQRLRQQVRLGVRPEPELGQEWPVAALALQLHLLPEQHLEPVVEGVPKVLEEHSLSEPRHLGAVERDEPGPAPSCAL